MNIENILLDAISGIFLGVFSIFCWNKLENKENNWKNYRVYLIILLMVIGCTIITVYVSEYFRIFSTLLLLMIINYLFVLKDIRKSIVSTFVSQFIFMISELIFVLLFTPFLGNNVENLKTDNIGIICINLAVASLSFLLLKTNIPQKIYLKVIELCDNLQKNLLISMTVITVLVASAFTIMTWMNLSTVLTLALNTILVLVYIGIIVKLLSTEVNFKSINSKYETSLSSLKEYETIMNKYRVDNHENKNQLLIIRNMIKSKDNNVVSYIENLVNEKIKDNETIFYKTSRIPEGGLRATIYSKMCKMEELNIKCILDIANEIKTVDLIKMGDKVTLDMCKIISVFLDNAIDEVSKLNKKEITVELFIMDNNLCIDISNNYGLDTNFEKIGLPKYTTKGDNHGYGLALVKELVKNNKLLSNEKIINKNKFTQRLKVNIYELKNPK